MDFASFIKAYLDAIKKHDIAFMKNVYGEWFDHAGFPKEQKEVFFSTMFKELNGFLGSSLEKTERFGDIDIVRMKDNDGSQYSLMFTKKGDSWVFFNERTNLSLFKKIYALGYLVDGEERLGILFNGKTSPILTDIGSSGFVSMINAALKRGENEIAILPGKKPVSVTIRISSGTVGGIINSSEGDVLSWEGVVGRAVTLKFDAK